MYNNIIPVSMYCVLRGLDYKGVDKSNDTPNSFMQLLYLNICINMFLLSKSRNKAIH